MQFFPFSKKTVYQKKNRYQLSADNGF